MTKHAFWTWDPAGNPDLCQRPAEAPASGVCGGRRDNPVHFQRGDIVTCHFEGDIAASTSHPHAFSSACVDPVEWTDEDGTPAEGAAARDLARALLYGQPASEVRSLALAVLAEQQEAPPILEEEYLTVLRIVHEAGCPEAEQMPTRGRCVLCDSLTTIDNTAGPSARRRNGQPVPPDLVVTIEADVSGYVEAVTEAARQTASRAEDRGVVELLALQVQLGQRVDEWRQYADEAASRHPQGTTAMRYRAEARGLEQAEDMVAERLAELQGDDRPEREGA